ncbi:MAG: hypothetical protein ACKVQJ_00250 [Pyrinomonadaceae bacterium]
MIKVKGKSENVTSPAERRSEVISAPGAALKVERFRLTPIESKSLTVNRRLWEIDLPAKKAA